MAQANIISLNESKSESRLDSEYFQKEILSTISKIRGIQHKKLAELCIVKSGKTPQYYIKNGKTKIIRSGDLNKDLFIDEEELLKTNENKLFFVQDNDVLISSIGRGSIGKINIYYNDKPKLATVSEVNILRNSKINPHYLFIFLRTKFGQKQIDREITGATGQQHLLKSNVRKIIIPIPRETLQNKIQDLVLRSKERYKKAKAIYQEAENTLLKEVELENFEMNFTPTFTYRYSNTLTSNRIDADYFQPRYENILNKIDKYGSDYISNILEIKDKNIKLKDKIYNYIELSNVGEYGFINEFISDVGENLPSRAKRLVHNGDVIISSIKGSVSSCALITDDFDNFICSNGFYVISSKTINPETILVLFKSKIIQELLKRGASGSILMSIDKKELQKIKIPLINNKVQLKLSMLIQESFKLKKSAKELLERAKKEVEDFIEKA